MKKKCYKSDGDVDLENKNTLGREEKERHHHKGNRCKKEHNYYGYAKESDAHWTSVETTMIMGKQPRGRPRHTFFKDINGRMGFTSYQHLKNK